MFTGRKSKFLIIFVILGLLVAMLPLGAASAAKCETPYAVKRGDTLTSIGKKFGYAANQIVYASKLGKPYTIYVGQTLCIPDGKNSNAPAVDSKYANALAAYFTAGRTTDSVLIYTYTYPKTTVLIKGASAAGRARCPRPIAGRCVDQCVGDVPAARLLRVGRAAGRVDRAR